MLNTLESELYAYFNKPMLHSIGFAVYLFVENMKTTGVSIEDTLWLVPVRFLARSTFFTDVAINTVFIYGNTYLKSSLI